MSSNEKEHVPEARITQYITDITDIWTLLDSQIEQGRAFMNSQQILKPIPRHIQF